MSESGGEPPRGRPRTGFDPDPQQVRGTPRPDQQPQPQTQPDTTVADGGTDRGQLTRRPVQRNLQPQADAGDGQGQTQNNAPRSPGWGGQQGGVDPGAFPARMAVDYVRVWQRASGR